MENNVIYDLYQERNKKGFKKKVIGGIAAVLVIIAALAANNVYLEILQLDEIGGYSDVYIKNLVYKLISFGICFVLVFAVTFVTNIFLKKNIDGYRAKNGLPPVKMHNFLISLVAAFILAYLTKETFYLKILTAMNATSFGSTDPIFLKDVGFYIFSRPFFITAYGFLSTLAGLVIAYSVVFYMFNVSSLETGFSFKSIKDKGILTHILINLAVFFVLKAVSYGYTSQNILFNSFSVIGNEGAGYVDVNIWLTYYKIAPYLVLVSVAAALFFAWRNKLKPAGISIAIYPAVWILTIAVSAFTQYFLVSPNEMDYEKQYISYNIEKTREAYSLDKIKTYDFPQIEELTPAIIAKNLETKNNIRVVDIPSTLVSNVQLQSNTAFYTFTDGDIINYTVNGKEIPVFISAREIDKSKLPDKTYLNTMYRYTHGYGIVMNPINEVSKQGQVEYILGGIKQETIDDSLVVKRPEIYFGENTKDHVLVKAKGLEEIDYDGTQTTMYEGEGGIKMNLLNKLLFAVKFGDFKMLISGYSNDATLLLNREIVSRAQKAVPFLTVDSDPYIILTDDGRLK
ncbi:MAG: COG1615 family transporter, partial [Clostridiales bacterium]|nr:COG1615 family transporter [Clostridiales bacterium]